MKIENGSSVVSEWEDSVLFDADDPDFRSASTTFEQNATQPLLAGRSNLASVIYRVPSNMSLAGIQGPHLADICTPMGRSSISVSSSLSDLVGSPIEISVDNVLTIEDLRVQMGSCFTCGVSWTDDHVSLDCGECGGYSLERPCPLCDGQCGVLWKRDFTLSHACGKARWQGVCPSYPESLHIHSASSTAAVNVTAPPSSCAASQHLAQELCARLEQLSASAQT